MQVIINNQEKEIPFILSMITLDRWIEYYKVYGRNLDNKLHKLKECVYSGDNADQEMITALEKHTDQEALSWYSFFSDENIFEAAPELTKPLLEQYRRLRTLLEDEDDFIVFKQEIEWNGDIWMIQDFKTGTFLEMSFNEYQLWSRVLFDLQRLSENVWDAVIFPLTIYFRKVNEPLSDIISYSDDHYDPILSEDRQNLLKSLPMNYVMSFYKVLLGIIESRIPNLNQY